MKPYRKIKCAGHTFKMYYPCNSINKDQLVGEIIFPTNTIKIANKRGKYKRTKSEIEVSIMHEMVHMVDRYYNGDSLSEKEVVRLSQGLYQVLKDNFGLKLLRR